MKNTMLMKAALSGASLLTLLLAGCADPMPGDAIVKATKACLDAGRTPRYFHNGAQTDFTCLPSGS